MLEKQAERPKQSSMTKDETTVGVTRIDIEIVGEMKATGLSIYRDGGREMVVQVLSSTGVIELRYYAEVRPGHCFSVYIFCESDRVNRRLPDFDFVPDKDTVVDFHIRYWNPVEVGEASLAV